MRWSTPRCLLLAIPLASAFGGRAWADERPIDPDLAALIAEALEARPELLAASAAAKAALERVPQAGAMPDPSLQVGLQNDGFSGIEIGTMESSFVSIMASEAFPWFGTLGLREEIAALDAKQSALAIERLRLSTEALVRRSFLDLQLARDRLALLERLDGLWEQAAGAARARYEASKGSQSDLLRAQLERKRLEQRRLSLRTLEQTAIQALNRLRGHSLDEPIETKIRVRDLGTPTLSPFEEALADARARSPELKAAGLATGTAERAVALAEKSYAPELVVSAGIMVRGGDFPPMWLVSVGGSLPIFAASRQSRAVAEAEARELASAHTATSVEQLLALRVRERETSLGSLAATIRVYESGLLVQAGALAESALAGYRVGNVDFSAVIEASAGAIADEEAYLLALAEAQRIGIAASEASLEPAAVTASNDALPVNRGALAAPPAARTMQGM